MDKESALKGKVNFQSLGECVEKGDHIGFLRSYMQLVIAGKELTVPTSLERKVVRGAWQSILLGVPGGDNEQFLDRLSFLWLNVMQRQGGEITETFAREILAILDNDSAYLSKVKNRPESKDADIIDVPATAPVVSQSSEKKIEYQPSMQGIQPEPEIEEQRAKRRNPKLETVQSDISKNYYDDVEIDSFLPPDSTKYPQKSQEAYQKKDSDRFLYFFLANQLDQVRPNLPLTSVLDIAFHKWKELILESLGRMPDEKFVRKIAERWYYLMNHYGLPTDRKKIKKLMIVLEKDALSKPIKKINNAKQNDGKVGGVIRAIQSLFE